ncbi:hypothetical protein L4C38_07000 [Vibrio kasasachensis]
MKDIKRREVTVPFSTEEMRKAFTPISVARKRRNLAKFSTPIGERGVKRI